MREATQKITYIIRAMEERDIPQVLELDREAFPSQWPSPTYSSYKQELRNKLAHYIVAVTPNNGQYKPEPSNGDHNGVFSRIFGFMGFSKHVEVLPPPSQELIIGAAGFWLMVGEVHIITIATRLTCRHMGVGEKLLMTVIDQAYSLHASVVTLEVRISNTVAQELYKKFGFNNAGLRRKYYTDNGENALIMTTDSIELPSFRNKFQGIKDNHLDRWGTHTPS
jgi:[ribosomal protein S18]-alanine N-acetyltransferase